MVIDNKEDEEIENGKADKAIQTSGVLNDSERITLIKERISLFHQKKMSVHIVTFDETWLRGPIINVYDDFFDIEDFRRGYYPIKFKEVKRLDKLVEKGVKRHVEKLGEDDAQ